MNSGDVSEASSSSSITKKRKISRGFECAAFGCGSTYYDSNGERTPFHFFKFPLNNPEKKVWCNLIKRHDGRDSFSVNKNTRLCHLHFKEDEYKRNLTRWTLHKGVKPSINLHSSFTSAKSPRPLPKDRSNVTLRSNNSVNVSSTTTFNSTLMSPPLSPNYHVPLFESSLLEENIPFSVDVGTQTDFSFVHNAFYAVQDNEFDTLNDHSYSGVHLTQNILVNICILQEEMENKIKQLSNKICLLQNSVVKINNELSSYKNNLFTLEKIKDDPQAIKFYTGFPNYESLLSVYKYLEPKLCRIHYWTGPSSLKKDVGNLNYQTSKNNFLKPGRKRSLSLLDEFFLVLLRLKVGLYVADIADRFNISASHVSKIFTTWINFLYHELPLLFPFPSQAMIRKYMPKQFKEYQTTRVIIDGTEIFVETPSSMVSQSQTWSQYKHHNTWKALVGISPNGGVTFVSDLWAGRVSDKQITKQCGILGMLNHGDNVMADRGFDIADILPDGVALNIPPFKGQRDQLTAEESEDTAKIAAVRIHVERAIGRIKNYHILDGTISLTLSPVINQVFTVCSYLTNFLPPLCPPSNDNNSN